MRAPNINREEAAELTDSTTSETEAAWHSARDDAEDTGDLVRGSGPGQEKPAAEEIEAQSLSGIEEAMAETDPDAGDDD